MKRIIIFFMLFFTVGYISLAQRNHGINWVTGGGNSYKVHYKDSVPFVAEFDFTYNFYRNGHYVTPNLGSLFGLVSTGSFGV